MRYFTVGYHLKMIDNKTGFGNITVTCEQYPSLKWLEKSVKDNNADVSSIIVLSIMEFNKEDFKSWQK